MNIDPIRFLLEFSLLLCFALVVTLGLRELADSTADPEPVKCDIVLVAGVNPNLYKCVLVCPSEPELVAVPCSWRGKPKLLF